MLSSLLGRACMQSLKSYTLFCWHWRKTTTRTKAVTSILTPISTLPPYRIFIYLALWAPQRLCEVVGSVSYQIFFRVSGDHAFEHSLWSSALSQPIDGSMMDYSCFWCMLSLNISNLWFGMTSSWEVMDQIKDLPEDSSSFSCNLFCMSCNWGYKLLYLFFFISFDGADISWKIPEY